MTECFDKVKRLEDALETIRENAKLVTDPRFRHQQSVTIDLIIEIATKALEDEE